MIHTKKALFVTHMLTRNGAPVVLLKMIDVVMEHGYEVDVISMEDGVLREDIEKRGINLMIVNHPMQQFDETRKLIEQYDLVICNTIITISFVLMTHGTGIPTIWWIHEGRSYFEMYQEIIRQFAPMLNHARIISVSPLVSTLVKEYFKVDSTILPFAVPKFDIRESNRKTAENVWGSISEHSKLRLIVVGPLSILKGQDIFIDAISKLTPKVLSDICIIFCEGTDQSDKEVAELVQQAQQIYNNIQIFSTLSHERLLSLIETADYLVANSRQESMPTVAAEAWMEGTPVILSDVCGICHYAVDEMRQLIYKMGDSDELSRLLIKLYSQKADGYGTLKTNDDGFYDQLVSLGHQVYESNFTESQFEKNVISIIGAVRK